MTTVRYGHPGGREPVRPWLAPAPTDMDVAIIGAGQSGVVIAEALIHAGIGRVGLFERAEPGGAGIWRHIARMETLRTVKDVSGPEAAIPVDDFATWYDKRRGPGAFAQLERVPRLLWAEYIDGLRDTGTVIPQYHHDLLDLAATEAGLRLEFATPQGKRQLTTRKVILATGIAGLGATNIPSLIRQRLRADQYAHTHDRIDLTRLKGQRVAVLGGACSAFDAAAAAIEAGAERADLFVRRSDLYQPVEYPLGEHYGAAAHFHSLPDDLRWKLVRQMRARGNVARHTVERMARYPNFSLHLGAGWSDLHSDGKTIQIEAAGKRFEVDFVIAGTGYRLDPALRPELRRIAPLIARWCDRYRPEPGQEDDSLASSPYLDAGFAFQERRVGTAPFLRNVHAFSYGGVVSNARHVGDIGTMAFYIPRLIDAVVRDFIRDEAQAQARALGLGLETHSPLPQDTIVPAPSVQATAGIPA